MLWTDCKLVGFDTETTGLHAHGGDRLIEIGLVVFRLDSDAQIVGRELVSHLINPERPIPREASEISHIYDADVADAPLFVDLVDEIREVLRDAVVVAHNMPFDRAFLTMEFERAGVEWVEPLASIDTLPLYRRLAPSAESHKLEALARAMSVTLENAHRATDDAEACIRSLFALAHRYEAPSELEAFLSWSGGLGRPPSEGVIGVDASGQPIFLVGPKANESVLADLVYLEWLSLARTHDPQTGFGWQTPERTRAWIRRYLDVRTASSAVMRGPERGASADWNLDSCIGGPRSERG